MSWKAVFKDDAISGAYPGYLIFNTEADGGHLAEIEHEADALKMAAAPDLLAALEGVLNVLTDVSKIVDPVIWEGFTEEQDLLRVARAAITKAKGLGG